MENARFSTHSTPLPLPSFARSLTFDVIHLFPLSLRSVFLRVRFDSPAATGAGGAGAGADANEGTMSPARPSVRPSVRPLPSRC